MRNESEIYFTVDRTEGGWAILVCPLGELKIPAAVLPEGYSEGDVFTMDHGHFVICPEESERSRKRVKKLVDSLFIE